MNFEILNKGRRPDDSHFGSKDDGLTTGLSNSFCRWWTNDLLSFFLSNKIIMSSVRPMRTRRTVFLVVRRKTTLLLLIGRCIGGSFPSSDERNINPASWLLPGAPPPFEFYDDVSRAGGMLERGSTTPEDVVVVPPPPASRIDPLGFHVPSGYLGDEEDRAEDLHSSSPGYLADAEDSHSSSSSSSSTSPEVLETTSDRENWAALDRADAARGPSPGTICPRIDLERLEGGGPPRRGLPKARARGYFPRLASSRTVISSSSGANQNQSAAARRVEEEELRDEARLNWRGWTSSRPLCPADRPGAPSRGRLLRSSRGQPPRARQNLPRSHDQSAGTTFDRTSGGGLSATSNFANASRGVLPDGVHAEQPPNNNRTTGAVISTTSEQQLQGGSSASALIPGVSSSVVDQHIVPQQERSEEDPRLNALLEAALPKPPAVGVLVRSSAQHEDAPPPVSTLTSTLSPAQDHENITPLRAGQGGLLLGTGFIGAGRRPYPQGQENRDERPPPGRILTVDRSSHFGPHGLSEEMYHDQGGRQDDMDFLHDVRYCGCCPLLCCCCPPWKCPQKCCCCMLLCCCRIACPENLPAPKTNAQRREELQQRQERVARLESEQRLYPDLAVRRMGYQGYRAGGFVTAVVEGVPLKSLRLVEPIRLRGWAGDLNRPAGGDHGPPLRLRDREDEEQLEGAPEASVDVLSPASSHTPARSATSSGINNAPLAAQEATETRTIKEVWVRDTDGWIHGDAEVWSDPELFSQRLEALWSGRAVPGGRRAAGHGVENSQRRCGGFLRRICGKIGSFSPFAESFVTALALATRTGRASISLPRRRSRSCDPIVPRARGVAGPAPEWMMHDAPQIFAPPQQRMGEQLLLPATTQRSPSPTRIGPVSDGPAPAARLLGRPSLSTGDEDLRQILVPRGELPPELPLDVTRMVQGVPFGGVLRVMNEEQRNWAERELARVVP